MQTSGIKIDIDKSGNLLLDNSKKIEKIIKFAVKQAALQQERLKPKLKDSKAVSVNKAIKKN